MGRYNPNLGDVQVGGITVLEKGDYEFAIAAPKMFKRTTQQNTESFGLGFTLRTDDSKIVYHTLYMHTDKCDGMNLEFVATAYGYNARDEKQLADFKAKHAEGYWVDFDEGTMGETFLGLAGKRIAAGVDVKHNERMQRDENTFRWRPFGS